MNPPSIHILHYPNLSEERLHSTLIYQLGLRWESAGLSVRHLFGCEDVSPADILFLHVDLSCVPSEYIEFASSYPQVYNRGLTDIRKRTISRHLVSRDCDYSGPVIVKTDHNHGGMPEREFGLLPRRRPKSFSRSLKKRLRIRDPLVMREPNDYLVYSKKSEVPKSVFMDDSLVVEKFQPEPHEDGYNQRRYFFLGDAEYNEVHKSRVAVYAADANEYFIGCHEVPEIPHALREYRKELKADFGKIDYVLRDGEVVVFDVNRTPTSGDPTVDEISAEWMQPILNRLQAGVYAPCGSAPSGSSVF